MSMMNRDHRWPIPRLSIASGSQYSTISAISAISDRITRSLSVLAPMSSAI